MNIGIIGAGAAGLAAAYELGKHGHTAVVYETAPFLGGQASTFDVGGAPLERGYHHLFTSDTDIVDLIHEIGLGHQMKWIESTVGILHKSKIYNFVTPLDLLRFSPLSIIDRFRLGLVTLLLQRNNDWRKLESQTADAWIRKNAGKRVYDVVWGPLLRGKFGEEHYKEVGMPWFWGKIHTRFASRGKGLAKELLGYPIGSFGEVFDVLAERVAEQGSEVHLSTGVKQVIVQNNRAVGLETGPRDGPTPTQEFDAIIATTPSFIFPKLVPSLPDDYLAKLNGVTYMAAVLLILELDRPLTDIYWLNVADRSIPFVGVIEHTNLIPPEHYGGKHIVYLTNYLSENHPLYKMSHEELQAEYIPHLKKINPDFDESWIQNSHYHRVGAAQPIIGTNYSQRIPDHRTPIERLYLANTTQIYPEDRGTNYSVRMGKHVARLLLEDLPDG
ncbi:MAG: NAD(P)/FAD-dependent oxidoreductase [Chloroflexi bacterium]|nr:NAD(P)/FAD-dependent oxidoreductase [Chloroflexota bacterium]